jgi:hypothetical protein
MKLISSLILASVTSVQAATYTYNMSADNDMTLYSSNLIGSTLTEHFNQTANWSVANTGSFVSFENYIYVVGMDYGSVGSFAGFINTTDVSTVPWELSSNVASALTGYTGSTTLYNPPIADVATLIPTETFTPAAIYTGGAGIGIPGVTNGITIPDDSSAYIFRSRVTNFENVPEPSTVLLGFGAVTLALFRRRRA